MLNVEYESGVNVKKNKVVLLVVSLLALGTGCARNYQGNYVGTQSLAVSGMSAVSSPMTFTINPQSNSNMISGTLSGSGISGTFQGTTNGGDIINGTVTLNNTGATVGGYPNTSGYPNTGYGTPGISPLSSCGTMTFMGSLTFTGNTLQGTLSSNGMASPMTQPIPGAPTIPTTGMGMGMCTGTLTLNATRQ
jgi:hypothetical protein